MSSKNFHDWFVDQIIDRTKLQDRVTALEHELLKVKKVIENLNVEVDGDIDIEGEVYQGYYADYDLEGTVSAGDLDGYIKFDELIYCVGCDKLHNVSNDCLCERERDVTSSL